MGNPLFLALIIGWIMTVCLHEYAHAVTAYLAGDRSVRERGYLAMNPLSYIDPINSIILPAVMLWMGGIPLPGGAVLIDRSALRQKWQASLVSAAGPLTNLVLFLLCAAVIHPRIGLVSELESVQDWPLWAVFAGAMSVLQIFAVLLNLLPVPPLDGFQVIEPFLSPMTRARIMSSSIASAGIVIIFAAFFFVPGVSKAFFTVIFATFELIGIPARLPYACYQMAFSR